MRSDILLGAVQIFDDGGEQELHSHSNMDGFWFVLKGRVRFYGKDRVVIADAGPHEGVFVPRNFAYWFEKVGEEPLELLQVEAIDRTVKAAVTRYDDDLPPGHADIFEPGGELIAADVQLTG